MGKQATYTAQEIYQTGVPLRPSWVATALFFLLFSGPPMFRLRDPNASLEGIIDPVIVFQVSVWIIAGMWTLLEIRRASRISHRLTLSGADKLGIAMAICLAISIPISAAPELSAFKIGQMFVCIIFTLVFVQLYGIARCLRYIFIGSLILCAGIVVSTFVAPGLVFIKETQGIRLRGDLIANTGVASAYAIMLLIIRGSKMANIIFWPMLSSLLVLLGLSLTREAWFVVLAFIVLYFVKRTRGVLMRNIGYATFLVLPALFIFYVLPSLQAYRSTASIWTLSDRTGLWLYLTGITVARSPWIGLGYYSASRVFGPEYNPGLGTAHSMFVEVFAGGGLLSLIPLLTLCILLSYQALQLILRATTRVEFACGTLFFATLAFGAMGADFGFGPVGMTFWILAAAIPILPKRLALLRMAPDKLPDSYSTG
jgi:hypothetical protein